MKNWLKWWTDHKRVIPLTIGAIVLLVISNMTSGSAVSLLCIAGALAMGIAVPLVARAEDREGGGTLTPIENLQTTTSAINALTARWCAAAPPGECALSGVGVWPLLALLEAGASGRALEKLRAATGVDPHEASRAV
ncbi:MAG TPA: hypothetical protein VK461_03455, partial [Acidimicrobiales bacterium]|nr:hypothetical protein [Acidimicrobiales bacterium]